MSDFWIDFMIKAVLLVCGLGFLSGIGLAWYFDNAQWLLISLVTGIFFMAG